MIVLPQIPINNSFRFDKAAHIREPYIAVYPALMVGLLLLVRRRSAASTDRGALDAAILTIGLAVPQWIALMAPDLHLTDLTTVGKVVQVLAIAVVTTVLLLLVGVVVYRIDLPSAEGWLTFVWVSLLGITSCTMLGIAVSSQSRKMGMRLNTWLAKTATCARPHCHCAISGP